MGLFGRRDVVRRCVRCGETWRVPGALVSGRQSKWRRGVSIPDRLGFRGMDTNASAAMRIDLAKQHGAGLERELETVSALAQCPGCGGVGTYTEERAPRRRSSS